MSLCDFPLSRPDKKINKSKESVKNQSTKRSRKSGQSTASSDIKPLMRALGKVGEVDKVFVVMDQKGRVWEIRCQDF